MSRATGGREEAREMSRQLRVFVLCINPLDVLWERHSGSIEIFPEDWS